MSVTWTEEQKKVIISDGRSLLVSAAAGSGKTAVLVERIIHKICDGPSPLDIDRLLVVTFTKAAAAEMKERVDGALDRRIEAEPDNDHLKRQKMLMGSAWITTIDSFCMRVLREHFNDIDLDPSFRVGDEYELTLLKQDILEDMLEEWYEKQDEDFLRFVDAYAGGKTDYGVEDMILRLYDFSQSWPWPDKWLDGCVSRLEDDSAAFDASEIARLIKEETRHSVRGALHMLCRAKEICESPGGPFHYLPMIEEDLRQAESLNTLWNGENWADFDQFREKIGSFEWMALSRKRPKDVDGDKKDQVKELRSRVKDLFQKLIRDYFTRDAKQIGEECEAIAPLMRAYVRLVKDFSERYQKRKQKKNLIDFSDQEHMALDILVRPPEVMDTEHLKAVRLEVTETAKGYARQFEEIMCDEYQDSNMVQETLLNSISREQEGRPNIFMVGDVKQSIYRFRMAAPEIFVSKYETFSKEESAHQRIDLHKNFRSRKCVLDSVNRLFERLMIPEVGGISYDADAALYPGMAYADTELSVADKSELLLLDTTAEGEEERIPGRILEARMIGMRIQEMMSETGRLHVWDNDRKVYRPAEYADMVILLRSTKTAAADYIQTLNDMGIPAIGSTSAGFFDTRESQLMLNMLRILDNPLQDIPMAAVLHSEIGGFSSEDLAWLRAGRKKEELYTTLKAFGEERQDELGRKCRNFLKLYGGLRRKKSYLSLHQLIWEIYMQTGYDQTAQAMNGGSLRRANLRRLVEYAKDYEKTSYRGLFHFIRYVERLKEYKVDMGEAVLPGEAGQAVRIMSIHASKGLEYPICFVAGLGRKINSQESREKIVIHPALGLAADRIDADRRTRRETLLKKVVARQLLADAKGEELRILYVALTRAREKLILVGSMEHLDKAEERWRTCVPEKGETLDYHTIKNAGTMLDWIMPAVFAQEDEGTFDCRRIHTAHLELEMMQRQAKSMDRTEKLRQLERPAPENMPIYEQLTHIFSWQYPKKWLTRIHGKMTVSELKKMTGEAEKGRLLYPADEGKTIPDFMQDGHSQERDRNNLATERGTAVHKILEYLPWGQIASRSDMERLVDQWIDSGKIPKEWDDLVDRDAIWMFIQSPIGSRMKKADRQGHLHREQPFVIGFPVGETVGASPEAAGSDETVLIQGVIDAWFEEEDGLVLLDYKTDRVRSGQAGREQLIRRYRVQLEYYQKALERITGKRVKERLIYSVALGEAILC